MPRPRLFLRLNSLIYYLTMFLDPTVIIPAIIGGIGCGTTGQGAYHMRSGGLKDGCVRDGADLTIIFLRSPMVPAVFLYVLMGNLLTIPGFLG